MRRPLVLLLAALVAACGETVPTATVPEEAPGVTGNNDSTAAPTTFNPDWTDATHTKITPPGYTTVFPQDSVNRIEITITAAQWTSVRNDMRGIWGVDFGQPRPGGNFPNEDPDYIAVPVRFNGKLWKKVGWRLKGNSTLHTAWTTGNYKLPFRLKTNEFEDLMPAVKGQRIYGFKELSFSPGRSDNALIREKVTADIFRMGGIPSARTAMYRVYVDFGAGMRYVGVYTVVEVIDDTMVKDQFGSDAGNLYKPESALRTFVEAEFEKKNNKTSTFADVQGLVTALNNPLRTTDAAAWRTALEATLNVDHFLKWLAINNAIVNWDSYGTMAQNYYLYNHPTNKLTWIPWDHNEAMIGSPSVVSSGGGPGNRGLSLTMNEVTSQWPLIRNLISDPVYSARYREHLRTFNSTVFSQAAMDALFTKYHSMIAPFAIGANGEQPGATYLVNPNAFINGLQELKTHIANRKSVIAQFNP